MTTSDGPAQDEAAAWDGATWIGPEPTPAPRPGARRQAWAGLRAASFGLLTLLMLPVYLIARPLGAKHSVAKFWCRAALAACGLRLRQVGSPAPARPGVGGVLLCNHASWLDILAIGATAPIHFVAKADIAHWPLFGWIGKLADTIFIERRRADAKAQEQLLTSRAAAGETLCIFPEGTSSDGLRVLPFKSSLFALFFAETGAPWPQPTTLHYAPPPGLSESFFGLWGRTPLGRHLWSVLCFGSGGTVTVIFHDPVDPNAFAGRKELAAHAQDVVEAGLAERARTPPG